MTAAAIASIVGGEVAAGGAVGGGVLASQGGGGGMARPRTLTHPKYAQALNKIAARATALNMNAVPPSFADYVRSGGTATFPWTDPGITPVEQFKLGIVGREGEDLPGGPNAALSDEERMFLAEWFAARGRRESPLYNLGRLSNKIDRVESRPETPKRERKLDRLRDKLERQLSRRGR